MRNQHLTSAPRSDWPEKKANLRYIYIYIYIYINILYIYSCLKKMRPASSPSKKKRRSNFKAQQPLNIFFLLHISTMMMRKKWTDRWWWWRESENTGCTILLDQQSVEINYNCWSSKNNATPCIILLPKMQNLECEITVNEKETEFQFILSYQ